MVIVDQRIALDIDLGGQLAVTVGADEEVDMRRALAVAAEGRQQPFGRASGRDAIARGQDALEPVAAVLVGDDRAAHVEVGLQAGRVEVRIEAARVAVPAEDLLPSASLK